MTLANTIELSDGVLRLYHDQRQRFSFPVWRSLAIEFRLKLETAPCKKL
jgi:hypothetical protein